MASTRLLLRSFAGYNNTASQRIAKQTIQDLTVENTNVFASCSRSSRSSIY